MKRKLYWKKMQYLIYMLYKLYVKAFLNPICRSITRPKRNRVAFAHLPSHVHVGILHPSLYIPFEIRVGTGADSLSPLTHPRRVWVNRDPLESTSNPAKRVYNIDALMSPSELIFVSIGFFMEKLYH